jgi:hypothetical protein
MSISHYLSDDHARLDQLLAQATVSRVHFDRDAFERFRAGLLRHIGIEEKFLLPEARRRRDGVPLPISAQLKLEHAALVALLVPTPDHALADEIRSLLATHNAREEGDGGVYAECEALAGAGADELLRRAQAATPPPLAAHFDGGGVVRTAAEALALAERSAARAAERKRPR